MNLQGIRTLSIFIFIQKWWKQKNHVFGQLQAFIITSCKKIVPIFIQWKSLFWQKEHAIFFLIIPLAHSTSFTPNVVLKEVIFQKLHIITTDNIQFILFNRAFYLFESSLYYNHHNYDGDVIVIPSTIILALGQMLGL